jgi:two-component system, sensor histidine kinase ChiS
MAIPARFPATDSVERLQARIDELESERRRLLAVVELLRELSGSLNYRDIVQTAARRMGYALGLDRCSVFLTERSRGTVHLVASYEDPSLRNRQVDLARYPELKRALETGEIVNIPDVIHEPALEPFQDTLASRRVQSITVVPMRWKSVSIGAVFLRTDRSRPPLGAADIQWSKVVADVTARALRTAHRFERIQARQRGSRAALQAERERAALLQFVHRLLGAAQEGATSGEEMISKAGGAEVDRLVSVALTVLRREAGG